MSRLQCVRWRATMWLGLVLTVSLGTSAAAQEMQAGAWDQSLALEAAGNLVQARAVLVAAFGAEPDTYLPCVRLAWLSLRLTRSQEAVALYRRARQLPNAQPEATLGLASALVQTGYQDLDRGDLAAARREWTEAVTLDRTSTEAARGLELVGAPSTAAPEVWVGRLSADAGGSSAGIFYVHVPVQISNRLRVRGAFRGVSAPSSNAGSLFTNQNEWFGGVTVDHGIATFDVVALRLSNPFDYTNGAAASVRVGGRRGGSLLAAFQSSPSGSNLQLAPSAFVWISPQVAFAGGVRLTRTPSGASAASANLGVTIATRTVEVDALTHLGTELAAFTMAGPTVLSFLAETTRGVTITASVATHRRSWVFGQVQVEQLANQVARYVSVAGGVKWLVGGVNR